MTARADEETAAGGEVFAGDREVAELRESPACRTVARIAQPDAGRRHLGTKSLEHRTHGRPRQVPVGQAQRFAADPGGDDFARIGPREAIRHSLAQLLRAGGDARVHDRRHHHLGHVRDEIPGGWHRRAGRVIGFLLNHQDGAVEIQHLAGERVPVSQVLRSAAAVRVRPGGDRRLRHHIFSRLTRKALNSGVRELASPTKGVSALASQ